MGPMTQPSERLRPSDPTTPLPPGLVIPAQRGAPPGSGLPAQRGAPPGSGLPARREAPPGSGLPAQRGAPPGSGLPAQRGAPPVLPAPPQEPTGRPRDRRNLIAGAVAVALVIGTAVGIGLSGVGTPTPAAAPTAPAGSGSTLTTFTPAPGSAPTTYTGRGDGVVQIAKDSGPAILQFECLRCSGDTRVTSDGFDEVLVDVTGSYSGRRLIDIRGGSSTDTVTVTADGAWRMVVSSGLGAARVGSTGTPIRGQGDDVLIVNGANRSARVENSGPARFAVDIVSIKAGTLLQAIDTTGDHRGDVSLDGPAVVAVRSSGSWTLTAS
jgi:hypothetical protein